MYTKLYGKISELSVDGRRLGRIQGGGYKLNVKITEEASQSLSDCLRLYPTLMAAKIFPFSSPCGGLVKLWNPSI